MTTNKIPADKDLPSKKSGSKVQDFGRYPGSEDPIIPL
jgi:hypothetical protein